MLNEKAVAFRLLFLVYEMLNEKALLFVESTGKYSFYTFRLFVFSAILCNFAYA